MGHLSYPFKSLYRLLGESGDHSRERPAHCCDFSVTHSTVLATREVIPVAQGKVRGFSLLTESDHSAGGGARYPIQEGGVMDRGVIDGVKSANVGRWGGTEG